MHGEGCLKLLKSLSFYFKSTANREQRLSFMRAVGWMWQSSRANLWVNINFHHHRLKLKAVWAFGRDEE